MDKPQYSCYIVLRKDLDMPVGKFSAQVGHAVGKIFEYYMTQKEHHRNTDDEELLSRVSTFENWNKEGGGHGGKKVILKADTELKLENLRKKLNEDNVKYFDIFDYGYNFFDGLTCTGLVLYPRQEELKYIKRLQCW
ncbi:peptidyl-tRNA hydrolase [Xanthomonas phage XaC1]|nr:peptidyl-tRNA hydrolase [Xanthomonas phage XaC1]